MSPLKPSPVPFKPHAYQVKAIKRGLEQAVVGYFLDPGLGKTSIILSIIKILLAKKMVGKILIIAPLRVAASTWPRELEKWLDFCKFKAIVLHGPKKDQLLQEDADIYLINPEGLDWLLKATKVKNGKKTSVHVDVREFKKLGFDMLVVDELTKFKNHQSIRFKAIKQVLGTFRRRYGLTGSPAANGLLPLFGQMYMLDEGRSLGRFITHYRDAYFESDYMGFSYTVKEGAEQEIYKRISPVVMRLDAADLLELPQKIDNVIRLELPASARKVYDALEDDLFFEMGSGVITAKNTGVALGKCRQVASGAIYIEDALGELVKKARKVKREWEMLHDTKLDALEDLVESLQGSPILIAYEFQHDLARLKERFGADLPYIGSGVSIEEGKRLEKLWNEGKLPVLAVHPVSIAHGVNMQDSGQHIAWFTLTWDYENYDQLIRRLLRQGSKHKKIFNHIFLMEDTIEEAVLGALHAKRRGQGSLFDGLKQLQARRRQK
jgi:SNF2 family DNA or RNA helicase